MKSRPIPFSAPMVRALLAGTKTQTRRALRQDLFISSSGAVVRMASAGTATTGIREAHCPYWREPGDRLWVRETSAAIELPDGLDGVRYTADKAFRPIENTQAASECWMAMNHYGGRRSAKVPAIHMPRWASRITLEITEVRVERLQDISEADAQAEGISYSERFRGYCIGEAEHFNSHDPRQSYFSLWEAINGAGSVVANPWIWALTFKVIT